jgi:ATP-dependent Clp endopeptidase proteolytic subunit ClpP
MRKKITFFNQEDIVPKPDIDKQPQLVEYKEPGYVEVINNRIYFYADIDRDKMLTLVKTLKEREDEMFMRHKTWQMDSVPNLRLYIQSYGGWAHAGFAGYDHIKNMDIPIHTYIDGVAASAATLLTLAGSKRYIHQNAFMMIHQARYDYWGTYTHNELEDQVENAKNLMEALKKVYLKETKIPEKKLEEILNHDLYFSAEECIEYGLADEIVGKK